MDTRSYKTISANKETANKQWVLINAEDEVLGRLASKAAMILRGKHKTNFTPHADAGDYVIIINAEKMKLDRQQDDRQTICKIYRLPGWTAFCNAAGTACQKAYCRG